MRDAVQLTSTITVLKYSYYITIFCVYIKERSMLKYKETIINAIMVITQMFTAAITNTSLCDVANELFRI